MKPENLIYSKGAVYAGFTTLLNEAGMDFSMVDRMIITGGFGQYLNIEKAVTIGLLPDIDRTKIAYGQQFHRRGLYGSSVHPLPPGGAGNLQ
jgi:uncharacterized 2Fe-2S/4Fe-4S cluster protein (DUF4445 family)